MASYLCLQLPRLLNNSNTLHSDNKSKVQSSAALSRFSGKDKGNYGLSKSITSFKFIYTGDTSKRRFHLGTVSSMASSFAYEINSGNGGSFAKAHCDRMKYNRVNCLLWVLHEAVRCFSNDVESLCLNGSSAPLSMAWIGKDVHQWHRSIAYEVAVYAMFRTAIEVEVLLSRERSNSTLPVGEILSPKLKLVEDYIESQLHKRQTDLVQWFRDAELPRIAGYFIPLLKQWSMEYAGSGVAGIVVAISCCAAVGKLCPMTPSCGPIPVSREHVMIELMDFSHGLVSIDKLHQLATEAGFESEFLAHFGKKILPRKNDEELEFWIGLAQKKLLIALQREPPFSDMKDHQDKIKPDTLAVLGLFAFLGRKTRLYLSKGGIEDADELVKDLLSYLECGIIFMYPEFSSISLYQPFMEVIIDEIGWLDIYASQPLSNPERKRSKHHMVQAEKEIILFTVFTNCYDVFSGFAHFCRSSLSPLDAELLAFLLRSQNLLAVCLEDYWAAYDRSCGSPVKMVESYPSISISASSTEARCSTNLYIVQEAQNKKSASKTRECPEDFSPRVSADCINGMEITTLVKREKVEKSNFLNENLLRKGTNHLVTMSTDLLMGTQLLLLDIRVSLKILLKRLHGNEVTNRERKKLKRTLRDITSLIPITVLMLLPMLKDTKWSIKNGTNGTSPDLNFLQCTPQVSVAGHAAMLAAIKKYKPSMIPSPYSPERLDIVKQLRRTEKMEIRSWNNLEDFSSSRSS